MTVDEVLEQKGREVHGIDGRASLCQLEVGVLRDYARTRAVSH